MYWHGHNYCKIQNNDVWFPDHQISRRLIYIKWFATSIQYFVTKWQMKQTLPISCFFGFSASPTVVNPSYKESSAKKSELLLLKVQISLQNTSHSMMMQHNYLNNASIPWCNKEKILYILSAPFRHGMQINCYNFLSV